MIPHGLSVVITAPSTFRWTYPVNPEKRLCAAQLLGADVNGLTANEMHEILPRILLSLISTLVFQMGWQHLAMESLTYQP